VQKAAHRQTERQTGRLPMSPLPVCFIYNGQKLR